MKPALKVAFSAALLAWSIFEGLSFLQLVLYPTSVNNTSISAPTLEHDLFLYLAPLSPALTILLLYSRWVSTGLLLAQRRWEFVRSTVRQLRDAVRPLAETLGKAVLGPPLFGRFSRFYLILSFVLAGIIGYFPYRVDLNPGGLPLGVDVNLYIGWLSQMVSKPVAGALGYAFTGPGPSSRPLLLVALYCVAAVSSLQPDQVIKILPVFLAIGLAGSSYLFVRLGGGGEEMAILTASLAAGCFTITVGIWASYYANWLALIESYLFLGVLVSLVRSISARKTAALVCLSLALLLTHPWTWILMMTIAGAFALCLWKTEKFRTIFLSFAGILIANVVVESVKTLGVSAFGVPAAGGYLASQTPAPFTNLESIWPNTVDAVILTYSGLLATSIVLILSLVYTLRLRYVDYFQRMLLLWVIVSSIPFAFLSGYFQSRILYDLPIPVLAAGGLMMTIFRIEPRMPRLLLLCAVVLINAVYALQSMRLLS